MTTIQVAHRSASPTIFALPASADWTRRIIRWIELSSPTLTASMSKEPNWFTVPLDTSSPGPLSTGRDSPVITAWLMEVWPDRITPSTGTVSPGRTRSRSPTRTCSAGTVSLAALRQPPSGAGGEADQLLDARPGLRHGQVLQQGPPAA